MSFKTKTTPIVIAAAVLAVSAPIAFAQSAGTSYTGTTNGVPGGPNGTGSNAPAASSGSSMSTGGSMGRSSAGTPAASGAGPQTAPGGHAGGRSDRN